ncbi:glycoside hydrolase family protein, partial [Escherichia coli]|uniref:glycoside hydrolase family protein n=1 Tax=Escherichia coli TaxID=562 RepID=UPI001FCEDB9F
SGKNIIRWLLKKRTNGSVRYCQYTSGIASFCPYNIGPGKCFPSTFYKRINAGDRKGACEAIRWWIKDGGRDCRIRSNNCYGQVSRRDQESALACWDIDR